MGHIKRSVDLPWELQGRYAKISKADWAEIALDYFMQMGGEAEGASYEDFMADAERRLEIIKINRKREK